MPDKYQQMLDEMNDEERVEALKTAAKHGFKIKVDHHFAFELLLAAVLVLVVVPLILAIIDFPQFIGEELAKFCQEFEQC